jgi:hypothetical protein
MIVERRAYVVKEGRIQDAVDVIKEAWEGLDFPNAHRIYMPIIGPYNVVVQELEFKDLVESQEFWAAFSTRPKVSELSERWAELRAPGGGGEVWHLVE